MRFESKITSKGQTTIPREVRDYLGVGSGERISYLLADGKATIVPRNKRLIDLVEDFGHPPVGSKTLEQIEEGIDEAWKAAGTRGLDTGNVS